MLKKLYASIFLRICSLYCDKEKVKKLRPPFSNDMTPAEIEEVLDRSIRQSERYRDTE